jgi:hypothetical protein
MLAIHGNQSRLCDGVSRREWLRVGGIGLGGLSLPGLLRARADASATGRPASAKSVIILFNGGGIPHHESFDPKPDAPQEIRGEFGVTHTRTPGLVIGDPVSDPVRPADYLATVFHCLGYQPETQVRDMEGRPLPISRGRVIHEIL